MALVWQRFAPCTLVSVTLQRIVKSFCLCIHLCLYHCLWQHTGGYLLKGKSRESPLCPRCLVDTGTLVHMLWKCPKLHRYWAEVISTINSIWNLRLTTDPKLCLLGWLDEEQYTPHTYIAILRTLFLARKLIARKWLSITAPTHTEWITSVNDSLIREQLTYKHRGSPQKFESIWEPWLDTPGLAPLRLVQNRILGGRPTSINTPS